MTDNSRAKMLAAAHAANANVPVLRQDNSDQPQPEIKKLEAVPLASNLTVVDNGNLVATTVQPQTTADAKATIINAALSIKAPWQTDDAELEFVPYKGGKSFAVFGEGTRQFKEQLLKIGHFNSWLEYKGGKRKGYIFANKHRQAVEAILYGAPLTPAEQVQVATESNKSFSYAMKQAISFVKYVFEDCWQPDGEDLWYSAVEDKTVNSEDLFMHYLSAIKAKS